MESPLVSVIIPCYNQGMYLQQAIDSVMQQTYPLVEIIVVDDGSIDNTAWVARRNEQVRYVYQPNQGLSAARNTGINHSKGDFLVFLDADDLLYPNAIQYNLDLLLKHPDTAFVSGGHTGIDREGAILWTTQRNVQSNHYRNFLRINYIGMHATVMYRRPIFDTVRFDTTLRACEDYNVYLTISATHPVLHHTEIMAAYRRHETNMSSNLLLMLSLAIQVLQRHEPRIQHPKDRKAYQEGLKNWPSVYALKMLHQLRHNHSALDQKIRKAYIQTLYRYRTDLFIYYLFIIKPMSLKAIAKRIVPSFLFQWAYQLGLLKKYSPKVGSIHAGDLERLTPFSEHFGYDRGGPIDRYYIENFLQQEAKFIQGRVLEIGDNSYTTRFGGTQVSQSDVLHVHVSNPQATIIGDLTQLPQVDTSLFDCIILTQTLHLIYDYRSALQTCYRILKPGGVLLLTSPGISPIDHGEWQTSWYWSFNRLSLQRMLGENFPAHLTELQTFGNVFVATAFLYGMGVGELTQKQLDTHDDHFQVIITAKACKPI